MASNLAVYLYALALVLPPAAVVMGALLLVIQRKAEARSVSPATRAA